MTLAAWIFLAFALLWLPAGAVLVLFRNRLDARIERVRLLREAQEEPTPMDSEYLPEAGTASSLTVGMIALFIGFGSLLIFLSEYF